jgi:hypothetical protein
MKFKKYFCTVYRFNKTPIESVQNKLKDFVTVVNNRRNEIEFNNQALSSFNKIMKKFPIYGYSLNDCISENKQLNFRSKVE